MFLRLHDSYYTVYLVQNAFESFLCHKFFSFVSSELILFSKNARNFTKVNVQISLAIYSVFSSVTSKFTFKRCQMSSFSNMGTGDIVGISLGGALFVIAVIGIIMTCCGMCCKNNKKSEVEPSAPPRQRQARNDPRMYPPPYYAQQQPWYPQQQQPVYYPQQQQPAYYPQQMSNAQRPY